MEKLVPSSKSEILDIIHKATKAHSQSPTKDLTHLCLQSDNKKADSNYVNFVTLLCDLVIELTSAYKESIKQRHKGFSFPDLMRFVERETMIHFGFEKRAKVENLLVRWSHKRRDRVDQILVRELHSEEAGWTDYKDDEVKVKDQLAENLFNALLQDTVNELKGIAKKKMKIWYCILTTYIKGQLGENIFKITY